MYCQQNQFLIDTDGLLADLPLTLISHQQILLIKIITLQSGTWSLTNFFKFSNRSKISLAVNLLVSFFPTWIVKWIGFFSIIGMRLCRISSTFAPRKFRTFTTCFFLRNLSSKNPFIIESPAITIVFLRYKSWLLLVLSFHE